MQKDGLQVDVQERTLEPVALEQALRAVDPAVLLVPARILRRAIKVDRQIRRLGLRVPHRKSYVIGREELLAIAEPGELDEIATGDLPDTVILLARPNASRLAAASFEESLTKYWRLLFHARIHVALDQQVSVGDLNSTVARARIEQIGQVQFEEVRAVLRQEDLLLPPNDDVGTYIEFAAVYLEFRCFAPDQLDVYFPALGEQPRIDSVLRQDIDAAVILEATRLPGAQRRLPLGDDIDDMANQASPEPDIIRSGETLRPAVQAAMAQRAERARSAGNLVRAALRTAVLARWSGTRDRKYRDQMRSDVEELAKRLGPAIELRPTEIESWTRALVPLVEYGSGSPWSPGARLLYDIQKVCIDHERGIYALDLRRWLRSLGQAPLKRWLPAQRDVLIAKHLRSAARRVAAVRLPLAIKGRLGRLLQSAVHRADQNLRERFRPQIDSALNAVNLNARNLPQRVARQKLVDELLDRISERGFLTMGDLRDALSRNNLKLPDLASFRQFLFGDQLLRADRRLGRYMQGVYRRGEIYLRLPQLLSSVAFGTPVGRSLTKYVAIPFGGAFLILEGLQHIIALATKPLHLEEPNFRSWGSIAALGVLLLGLMHLPRFRAAAASVASALGRAAHAALVDAPLWLLNLPVVHELVTSWWFSLLRGYLLKPILVTVPLLIAMAAIAPEPLEWIHYLAVFLAVNLMLNSRLGRSVDEVVTDWVVHAWHRLRVRVLASIFRMIMDTFNQLLETLERMLYAVDEWLRFRAGERRAATAAKAVLGFFWLFVNYIIRFCVTLLIEPQINPIKHFPVVTVSHKILFPFTFTLVGILIPIVGKAWANTIGPIVILVLPGVFGFLVWELKENWRLYEANRPKNLRPVNVGSHGETMLQLMRPGFRSGTLPKLFAKLRRSYRRAQWTGNWRGSGKVYAALHHVEKDVRSLVTRELIALLRGSRGWGGVDIRTGRVQLATKRILVELDCPDLDGTGLWLALEEQSGWLVASIPRQGWFDRLSKPQRHTLANALAGFYKIAGVDLVHEQIAARLDRRGGYRIAEEGLVVWDSHAPDQQLVLQIGQSDQDGQAEVGAGGRLAGLRRSDLVFAATEVSWRRWVITWEMDQLPGRSEQKLLEDLRLLPQMPLAS